MKIHFVNNSYLRNMVFNSGCIPYLFNHVSLYYFAISNLYMQPVWLITTNHNSKPMLMSRNATVTHILYTITLRGQNERYYPWRRLNNGGMSNIFLAIHVLHLRNKIWFNWSYLTFASG